MSQYDVNHIYAHHPTHDGQLRRYKCIREGAKLMAKLILDSCPDSRERSLALTNMEQSVMWANAAIARNDE